MKKIFLAFFVILSMFLVSCGSSDSVKEALNDTSDSTTKFSQDEIDFVNTFIEEMKQYGYTVTSKTINSTTMQVSGNYSYTKSGNTVTGTFSEKIEKKNGIVIDTYVDSNYGTDISYELTIPRVLREYKSEDFFTNEQDANLSKLLSDNGFKGFSTNGSWFEIDGLAFQLRIEFGHLPNYTYEGNIAKYNNKYYLLDPTGVIASENTLEALIANTNVKAKLQKELNIVLAGTYSGDYSGNDYGSWNITVNSNGSITGTTISDNSDVTYSISGTLNGNTATLTASSGATLTATISPYGIISGTWANTVYNISGTLSGSSDN